MTRTTWHFAPAASCSDSMVIPATMETRSLPARSGAASRKAAKASSGLTQSRTISDAAATSRLLRATRIPLSVPSISAASERRSCTITSEGSLTLAARTPWIRAEPIFPQPMKPIFIPCSVRRPAARASGKSPRARQTAGVFRVQFPVFSRNRREHRDIEL